MFISYITIPVARYCSEGSFVGAVTAYFEKESVLTQPSKAKSVSLSTCMILQRCANCKLIENRTKMSNTFTTWAQVVTTKWSFNVLDKKPLPRISKTLDLLKYPIATVAFPYCDTKSATDEGDSTDWPTYIEKNWS